MSWGALPKHLPQNSFIAGLVGILKFAGGAVVSQFEIHSPCALPEPGRILCSWQIALATRINSPS